MMDRKLITFLVSSGLVLLIMGFIMLAVYCLCKEEYHHTRPLVVIGPVLIGASLMTAMFSLEICVRLYQAQKRVQDRDLDSLGPNNLHEVKHWMDPKLIPYGWGLFDKRRIEERLQIGSAVGSGNSTPRASEKANYLLISPSRLETIAEKDMKS